VLEIRRLKNGIQLLRDDATWRATGRRAFEMLATDGVKIYRCSKGGHLEELTPGRQRTFAFVLNVTREQAEIKGLISADKLADFSMLNHPLRYARTRRKKVRASST